MPSIDYNRGAKRAREARAALGLHPVHPISCLLTVVEERVRVPVMVAEFPNDVAGACWRDGEAAVLWVNARQWLQRRRFTLAHEVGHVWCKHHDSTTYDSIETIYGSTRSPVEVQANAFAAEFLLPKQAAVELFAGQKEPALGDVVVFAGAYGVSALVALIRLENADLVGRKRARQLRDEIEAGHHRLLEDHLKVARLEDRMAAMTDFPYFSPGLRDGALHAAHSGATTVTAAARAAGVSATALAPALAAIS